MANKLGILCINPCVNFILMLVHYNLCIKLKTIFVIPFILCGILTNIATFLCMSREYKKSKCFFASLIIYVGITIIYVFFLLIFGTGGTVYDDEGYAEGFLIIIVYSLSILNLLIGNLIALIVRILQQHER